MKVTHAYQKKMSRGSFALTKRDADALRALAAHPDRDASAATTLVRFCLGTKGAAPGKVALRPGGGLRFDGAAGLSVTAEVTTDHVLKLAWNCADDAPRPSKCRRR